MHLAAQFIVFLAAAYGLAVVVWPALGAVGVRRWIGFAVAAAILFTPLVIAPEHIKLRALACVLAVELFFKTTDYAGQRRACAVSDRRFLAYARFLVPFPALLVRFGQGRSWESIPTRSNQTRTGLAMIAFGLSFAMLDVLSRSAIVRSSFVVDHTLKFLLFAFAIESLARSLYGLEQQAGYNTRPLIDAAHRSQTVGEFWTRYNTRVHAWFDHNIFRRFGGGRAPVRAVFLVFFVSAILHELGFAIATSRVDGYQIAFFMLQAPAVVVGHFVQRPARAHPLGRLMLRGSTILWMWATSMFFFHGVDRVFPFFYVARPWLP